MFCYLIIKNDSYYFRILSKLVYLNVSFKKYFDLILKETPLLII